MVQGQTLHFFPGCSKPGCRNDFQLQTDKNYSCYNTNKGGGEKSLIQWKAIPLSIYNARAMSTWEGKGRTHLTLELVLQNIWKIFVSSLCFGQQPVLWQHKQIPSIQKFCYDRLPEELLSKRQGKPHDLGVWSIYDSDNTITATVCSPMCNNI